MATLPSSLALTTIADGSPAVAADVRNNYSSIQTAVNSLLSILGGGVTGQFFTGNGSTVSMAYPPGFEFDYKEVTTDQTATATTTATANAIVTGNPVTYDGSTAVVIEFYCANWELTVTTQNMILSLYDGATELGVMETCRGGPVATQENGFIRVPRKLTPSAGAHTYSIRASVSAASTATFKAGAGTIGVYMPMYLRITKA